MYMKLGHGMNAFSKTSIACRKGHIDMLEPHFHNNTPQLAARYSIDLIENFISKKQEL